MKKKKKWNEFHLYLKRLFEVEMSSPFFLFKTILNPILFIISNEMHNTYAHTHTHTCSQTFFFLTIQNESDVKLIKRRLRPRSMSNDILLFENFSKYKRWIVCVCTYVWFSHLKSDTGSKLFIRKLILNWVQFCCHHTSSFFIYFSHLVFSLTC